MTDQRRIQPGKRPEKAYLALLRHVAGHTVRHQEGEPGTAQIRLQRPGEAPRAFDRQLVARAVSEGLLTRDATFVSATPQTSAFLRRAMLAPDEGFQDQHRDLRAATLLVEGTRSTVRVNDNESPLAAMARLKDKTGQAFLPQEAIDAGERLHADFTRAHLQPRLTMSYEPRLSSKTRGTANPAADLTDTALAARLRIDRAVHAMGPELAGVALDICCFMKGLELVERERQWPARSAKLMLRTALLALARHYAPAQAAASRHRSWGAEGFRPSLDDAAST